MCLSGTEAPKLSQAELHPYGFFHYFVIGIQWPPTLAINPWPSPHLRVPFCLQVEPRLAIVASLITTTSVSLRADSRSSELLSPIRS